MSNLIELSAIREAAERHRVTDDADYHTPPSRSPKTIEHRETRELIANGTEGKEAAE